tara:strand:- start:375 stop:971 length:597 start_codon:yes stop_codon:yes gene_type:complete
MPLNIDDFRTTFGAEPAPTNRFEVYFEQLDRRVQANNPQNLQFRIDTAELPPRSLATVQDKIYGPIRNMPYTSTYVDTTMSFICTSNGLREKKFFDLWQNFINDSNSYDVEYWKTFTCKIRLLVYNNLNSLMYTCIFQEAYPMIVSGIQLSQANDEFARINVTFSFHKWTIGDNDTGGVSSPPESQNSLDFEQEYQIG